MRRCLLLAVPVVALIAPPAAARGLTSLLRKEATILTDLSQLSGQVMAVEDQLEDLKHDQQQLRYQIDEARRRIAALQGRSDERRHHLRQRVRGLYKLSRGGMTRLVLEGQGSDLAQRISSARLILRRDVRELALYQQERRRLEKEQRKLTHKLTSGERLQQQLARRRQELDQTREQQRLSLKRVRRSQRKRGKLTEQLSKQQQRLVRKIGDLRYEIRRSGSFASRRGQMKPPVSGPVVGVFGHKIRAGRRELDLLRHGITFRPRRTRARVRSVAAGTVRLSGPLDGYGNVVLLQHPGGYFTLYGHLARLDVKEGQRVKEGQDVGRSGIDPLNARQAVYFELRRGQRPLDPVSWIRR